MCARKMAFASDGCCGYRTGSYTLKQEQRVHYWKPRIDLGEQMIVYTKLNQILKSLVREIRTRDSVRVLPLTSIRRGR